MNLYLFDEKEIILFTLPDKIIGDFWMTDEEGKNIVNVNAKDNQWIISGGNNSKIIFENNYINECVLKIKSFYLVEKNLKKYVLYVDNVSDNTFNTYKFNGNINIKIGKDSSCDVCCTTEFINDLHAMLSYNNGYWFLKRNNNSLVYLNNSLISEEQILVHNGDVINIFGLKIILAFNILFINNSMGNVRVNNTILNSIIVSADDEIVDEEIIDKPMYDDEEYFFKSPRIRRTIEELNMKIDSPPSKVDDKGVPMIYTLGPMLTMGASSVVNISDTMSKIGAGERSWADAAPSLVVSGAMLCSMMLWPFLTKMYEKKRKKDNEEKRQLKYKTYINDKKRELQNEYNSQMQILEDNKFSSKICI